MQPMAKIYLRKVRAYDKKYFIKWWRDLELIKLTSGVLEPLSDQELNKSFLALLKAKNEFHFLITVSGNVIGHISLSKKNNEWYETQIIIGEKDYWNQGFGTRAIQNIIRRASNMGVSKIYLEVKPDNCRAVRAYEKAGFQKIKIKKYPKNKYLPKTLKMELTEGILKT